MATAKVNGIRAAHLRCFATRGMFPHECAVTIKGKDRRYESMIDEELLRLDGTINGDREVLGKVNVEVVNVNGEDVLVELPRQVVSGGRRIWVPRSEVEGLGNAK
jgi:hypothetical protein